MSANAPASGPANPPTANKPTGRTDDAGKSTERRVGLRVFIYVVAAHFFAAFIYLLFVVGKH